MLSQKTGMLSAESAKASRDEGYGSEIWGKGEWPGIVILKIRLGAFDLEDISSRPKIFQSKPDATGVAGHLQAHGGCTRVAS